MDHVRKRKRDRKRHMSKNVEPANKAKDYEENPQPGPTGFEPSETGPVPSRSESSGIARAELQKDFRRSDNERVQSNLKPRTGQPPQEDHSACCTLALIAQDQNTQEEKCSIVILNEVKDPVYPVLMSQDL